MEGILNLIPSLFTLRRHHFCLLYIFILKLIFCPQSHIPVFILVRTLGKLKLIHFCVNIPDCGYFKCIFSVPKKAVVSYILTVEIIIKLFQMRVLVLLRKVIINSKFPSFSNTFIFFHFIGICLNFYILTLFL